MVQFEAWITKLFFEIHARSEAEHPMGPIDWKQSWTEPQILADLIAQLAALKPQKNLWH